VVAPRTLSQLKGLAKRLAKRLDVRDAQWHVRQRLDRWFPSEFSAIYDITSPYSLCGYARLRAIYHAVHHTLEHQIPGDVVECGCARGGSAATAALTLKAHPSGAGRRIWLFDSFAGLPPPTAADPDYDLALPWTGTCRGELTEVQDLFRALAVFDRAVFVQGLFEETVPETQVGPIAVLHLDGDWYSSVKVCLDHLYDRVSPGGVIQIDDYGHWEGARKAVDEFLTARGEKPDLRYVDYTGRQWIKE
jgi:hypothetical protein